MKQKTDTSGHRSFQHEIARKIIIQVGSLTLLLCAGLIGVFALEVYWATQAELTTCYVVRMLLEILGVTCLFCTIVFVMLYFVSRNVAQQSLQPLHEALARERAFTSYASHEFRTPLAVLRGSMEVLIRKPRTEAEYRSKIQECIGEVDAMNRMVEDLLTLTRVESGRRSLQVQPVAVADMFNDILSQYAEQLIVRHIHIMVDVRPEGAVVQTDSRVLCTIMSNVVSNAVKYCNDGGSVSLESVRVADHIHIRVSNTGRGIAQAELSHVFDQFYRGADTQQRVKGFGLGLAIVRQFADIIGAQVSIQSDVDQPTTITLSLPAPVRH